MWVESELGCGSKFFFTIENKIDYSSPDVVASKMQPYLKRKVLYVDTLRDSTGVASSILDLGLMVKVVHHVEEVEDKELVPFLDAIVVDSLASVSDFP